MLPNYMIASLETQKSKNHTKEDGNAILERSRKICQAIEQQKIQSPKLQDELSKLIQLIGVSDHTYEVNVCETAPDDDEWESNQFQYRTQSMIGGPFFTSNKYVQNPGWMPVAQLNLVLLSNQTGIEFGDGLLQFWYLQGKDFNDNDGAKIFVIPKDEVNENEMVEWRFHDYWSGEFLPIQPLTSDWSTFYYGEGWKTIEGLSYAGIQCQDILIKKQLGEFKFILPNELIEKINELTDVCGFRFPGQEIATISGTFNPINYSHADVGKKCLISFHAWGNDGSGGNCQIFFERNSSGDISFELRENWYDSEESRDRHFNVSEMKDKAYKKNKVKTHEDFISRCRK